MDYRMCRRKCSGVLEVWKTTSTEWTVLAHRPGRHQGTSRSSSGTVAALEAGRARWSRWSRWVRLANVKPGHPSAVFRSIFNGRRLRGFDNRTWKLEPTPASSPKATYLFDFRCVRPTPTGSPAARLNKAVVCCVCLGQPPTGGRTVNPSIDPHSTFDTDHPIREIWRRPRRRCWLREPDRSCCPTMR